MVKHFYIFCKISQCLTFSDSHCTDLITAAHCVDANINNQNPNHMVYVYTGSSSENFATNQGHAFNTPTSQVRVHPDWTANVGEGHDIAIMTIPASQNPNWTQFVKLATQAEYEQLNRCDFFTVYGTGTTNTGEGVSDQLLKTADMQYLNCETSDMSYFQHYSNHQHQGNYNLKPGFDHALCMNSTVEFQPDGFSGICQGDSGGPLMHKDKLYGLVSYNYSACRVKTVQGLKFGNFGHFQNIFRLLF